MSEKQRAISFRIFDRRVRERRLTDSRPEKLEVFHQSLRLVLCIENRQLGEHSHVSSLETETSFEKRDELVGVTSVLVKLDEGLLHSRASQQSVPLEELRMNRLPGAPQREQ